MCIDCQKHATCRIKLEDVCQYEDIKKPKNKVKHIYFFDTRNQNQI
jgi:hypothetical protein